MGRVWYCCIKGIITVLIFTNSVTSSSIPIKEEDQKFSCKSGQEIVLTTKVNDGVADCKDGSDEFEDALVLSLFVPNINNGTTYYVTGVFQTMIENPFTSKFTMKDVISLSHILASFGPYIYFQDTENFVIRISRNGSNIERIKRKVDALAFDEITGNAYIIENGSIKLCDNKLAFCSTILSSTYNQSAISLTFTAEHGYLFWVEKQTGNGWLIVKARRDGTQQQIIRQFQNTSDPPIFVTIDQYTSKFYWLTENRNVYSCEFNGTNQKLHPQNPSPEILSIAVYNGTPHWGHTKVRKSTEPLTYDKSNDGKDDSAESSGAIIQVSLMNQGKNENPCAGSMCSHLCTYSEKNITKCLCEDPEVMDTDRFFCEKATLLLGYGSNLYIIGLKKDIISRDFSKYPSIIRKVNINTTNSISRLSYDSVKGRIIFSMDNERNIYAWVPGEQKPQVIHQENSGTISSLEFDDHGNNLYFINPMKKTLNVMSFATNKTMVLLEENNSTIFDFTLAPKKGYAFILLECKNKTLVCLERCSMDGDIRTRISLQEFKDVAGSNLSLHYMRNDDTLLLMDRTNNKIKFIIDSGTSPDIMKLELLADGIVDSLDGMTSLGGFAIWLEQNQYLKINAIKDPHVSRIQKIPEDFGSYEDKLSTIVGVTSSKGSSSSECRYNNGDCPELCLISETKPFICQNANESINPSTTPFSDTTATTNTPSTATKITNTPSPTTTTTNTPSSRITTRNTPSSTRSTTTTEAFTTNKPSSTTTTTNKIIFNFHIDTFWNFSFNSSRIN